MMLCRENVFTLFIYSQQTEDLPSKERDIKGRKMKILLEDRQMLVSAKVVKGTSLYYNLGSPRSSSSQIQHKQEGSDSQMGCKQAA